MSDNLKRYCAIQKGLTQLLPSPPTGNRARHLNTLAALVSGLIGSRHTHLPAVADKTATKRLERTKRESRIKSYQRWLKNTANTAEAFFLPYALALVASLPQGPLVLVMDGSEVGRGCMALVVSVICEKRALPLCWKVVQAQKGHFPEATHIALLEKVHSLIPAWRPVIFLGDGEFDGTGLLTAITGYGWQFVCRTAKNVRLCITAPTPEAPASEAPPSQWSSPAQLLAQLRLEPGEALALSDVLFTAQGFGPVQIALVWEHDQKEPLFLVTNLRSVEEAPRWYKQRFRIETFFSDQKSRGFCLHKSHLSDPERLARLMIATCLAYLWLVCLGVQVVHRGWQGLVHRPNRRDVSLFQMGLIWLEHCLKRGRSIPFLIGLPGGLSYCSKSVR